VAARDIVYDVRLLGDRHVIWGVELAPIQRAQEDRASAYSLQQFRLDPLRQRRLLRQKRVVWFRP
jgi:hypothetical protein